MGFHGCFANNIRYKIKLCKSRYEVKDNIAKSLHFRDLFIDTLHAEVDHLGII